jgi:hypothetical protein
MWEIIERTEDFILWQGRDAEGRRIYAATKDQREPVNGLYSREAAIEDFIENQGRG